MVCCICSFRLQCNGWMGGVIVYYGGLHHGRGVCVGMENPGRAPRLPHRGSIRRRRRPRGSARPGLSQHHGAAPGRRTGYGRGMVLVAPGRGMVLVASGRGMVLVAPGRGMVLVAPGRGMVLVAPGRGMVLVASGRVMILGGIIGNISYLWICCITNAIK
jgi:hypothetical protein